MGLFDWLTGKKEAVPVIVAPVPKQKDRIAELCRIKNEEIAKEVDDMDMMSVDLPEETLKMVRSEVRKSAAKGQNPLNCNAAKYLPDEFKWLEYDNWQEIIEPMKRKPDMYSFPKKIIYQMTLMYLAQETATLQEWKNGGTTRVKLEPCPRTCQLCRKIPKVYPIDKAPRIGYKRHPGCRCCFRPVN